MKGRFHSPWAFSPGRRGHQFLSRAVLFPLGQVSSQQGASIGAEAKGAKEGFVVRVLPVGKDGEKEAGYIGEVDLPFCNDMKKPGRGICRPFWKNDRNMAQILQDFETTKSR